MNYQKKTDELIDGIKKYSPQIGGFTGKSGNLVACCDGVGTKVILAKEAQERFNRPLKTIGQDCVAMVINDMLCEGARPMFFLDYFASGFIKREDFNQVLEGIHESCEYSGFQLIGGETAELSGVIQDGVFDVCGFGVGTKHFRIPHDVKVDDAVIGLFSSGFHSNGYTLIRKHTDGAELSELGLNKLLEPTKIYTREVEKLRQGDIQIKALAHITGGGFDNIKRVIPEGLVVEYEQEDDFYHHNELFKWIQNVEEMNMSQMRLIFNCGIGMMIVTNHKNLDEIKLRKDVDWVYLGRLKNE